MNTTPNYGFLLYGEDDETSWLQHWNDTMSRIDTACAEIAASIPESANLQPVIELANQANVAANKALGRTGDSFFIKSFSNSSILNSENSSAPFTAPTTAIYNIMAYCYSTTTCSVKILINGSPQSYDYGYKNAFLNIFVKLNKGDIISAKFIGAQTSDPGVINHFEVYYADITQSDILFHYDYGEKK